MGLLAPVLAHAFHLRIPRHQRRGAVSAAVRGKWERCLKVRLHLGYAVQVQFSTAGRDIGTGLLAVDIVSHWTWASILLQCVSYGYFYGATGPYWCASVSD